MLSSISPVGEQARAQRWGLTATAYTVGSALGGASTGLLAGGIGQLLLSGLAVDLRLAAVGLIAVMGVVADTTTGVPSLRRQVDERWLDAYRGWVYGGGFGLQLGTGVATIIPSSIVYAMWLGVVLLADWRAGAAVGAGFGLVRATPLVAAGRIRTVAALRRALSGMDRRRRQAARAVTVGQTTVAVLALATAVAVRL